MIVHPIEFVESLIAADKQIAKVRLSVYRYHPESLFDDRTSYIVPGEQLRAKYEMLRGQLLDNEDIAFHSVITVCDKRELARHFGLVDFVAADITSVERAAEVLVAEYASPPCALVHSGRSYHLYMGMLLTRSSWTKFMGRLLLLNPRNGPPVIDARWVGHRLMGGYSALRWSAKHSSHLPEIVRQWWPQ
jgi:hypothetical protein